MGFFGRVFLSYLLVIVIVGVGMVVIAGLVSPDMYRAQLDSITLLFHPEFIGLRLRLEEGYRRTLLWSLVVTVPASLLLATGAAYLEARRLATTIGRLARGGRDIAAGQYGRRLEVTGKDELAVLARDFNEMAASLEKAEKNRVELIASVAHEIKIPLTALRGYAEALTDGVLPPERAAEMIAREAIAMGRLADDLLLLTRVEAGAFELKLAAHEVGDIVAEVQDRFAHAFEERDQELCLELAADLPRVYADQARVEQVLSNLLSNALRYAPGGGWVVLGAQACEGAVRFTVADNGPGISPEHRENVFRRFYRVEPARSRGEGSVGVGLTVARGLVEAMGGRIWLESELGRGTSFYFTLPTAP